MELGCMVFHEYLCDEMICKIAKKNVKEIEFCSYKVGDVVYSKIGMEFMSCSTWFLI